MISVSIYIYYDKEFNLDLQSFRYLYHNFKTMDKKLYNIIMLPAMLLSWLFGILLLHSLGFSIFSELWMQIKIIAVIILTYYHFTLGKYLNDFALDNNQKSSKFFRIYNEIPTIILIVVIFVAIFKPI